MNAIDSENIAKPAPEAAKAQGLAQGREEGQAGKKGAPARKRDKGDRSNKKAEVIAMMKRAKGVTLAEIMKVTGWQAHTIRGFVSILGGKGGETIKSSKNASGERTYAITK